MDRTEELRAAGELQSRLCRQNGSPTYAAIIDALAARLDDDHAAVALLRADPRDAVGSALYLRFLGAVNRLALAGPGCPLRDFFPTTGGKADPGRVVDVFLRVVAENADRVAAGMTADVQTNEVGRSAPLSAAMNHIARTQGPALRLLEVGASAGLNLWPDRYRVDAGAHQWGPADSPVVLSGHFVEGRPPAGGFDVVDRAGCDPRPVDLADPAARTLLRSFVWPEHVARLRRLDAAMSAVPPLRITAASAVDWLRDRLAGLGAGMTTVVYHSIVWPYLSDAERRDFTALVEEAGRRAGPDRRLAWLSLEPNEGYHEVRLTLRTWPGGRSVLLAESSPHGDGVRWKESS